MTRQSDCLLLADTQIQIRITLTTETEDVTAVVHERACAHLSHPGLGRPIFSSPHTGVSLSSLFTLCRRGTSELACNCGKHGNAIFIPGPLCSLNGQLLSSVSHYLTSLPPYFFFVFQHFHHPGVPNGKVITRLFTDPFQDACITLNISGKLVQK